MNYLDANSFNFYERLSEKLSLEDTLVVPRFKRRKANPQLLRHIRRLIRSHNKAYLTQKIILRFNQ